MDHGVLVEEAAPAVFFKQPKNPRTAQFLAKVLNRI
jgi:ABC-type polar amino acid transport system ATPase subunit